MTTRVVVVDDHRIVREGLAYMLGEIDGVELVGEAGGGAELFDLLEGTQPDVILLDVHMPAMSGLEVLERLRNDHPDMKVIMLSMHDEPAYVQEAIKLGAMGYVVKSAGLEELVRALDQVMGGRPYLQGELLGALVPRESPPQGPHLSPREIEILQLLSAGFENKQIARHLDISEATVKTHIKALFGRLDVRTRAEAVATGLRLGLIE